jgi:hypothetical protein
MQDFPYMQRTSFLLLCLCEFAFARELAVSDAEVVSVLERKTKFCIDLVVTLN